METTLIEQLEIHKNKNELLHALLFTARDNWHAAHKIAQKREGQLNYDRIHALLHRIEGDEWNAKYWYRRINQPYERLSIEDEWNELTTEYLELFTR